MKHPSAKPFFWIAGLAILALLALPFALLLPAPAQAAETTPPTCSGDTYTAGPGDTWYSVSRRTGVSVAALKQLNPGIVRPNGWLWIGDQLCLSPSRDANGYWYEVQPGDTWNTVARKTGMSVQELWLVNPTLANRLQWLYIGQRLWVPGAASAAVADATATAAAAAVAAATLTETATPPPTATATTAATATPTATAVPTQTAAAAPTQTATAAPRTVPAAIPTATRAVGIPATATVPVRTIKAGCAADLAAYPDLILAYLNAPGNKPSGLKSWLIGCGAITADPDAVATAAIQSATSVDVLVALHDPALQPPEGRGMLLIYHAGPRGYKLVHQVASEGNASLLTVADLNVDKKPDVVWVDTTCGAHTCNTTLHVDSWDGAAYQDWISGEPSMASAEFKFADVTAQGDGQEIVLNGGLIDSVGAGPQRSRTETYASIKGAPYALVSQVFSPSTCLYHKIVDANAAFARWTEDGFGAAVAAYKAAIDDKAATACGTIADELATLRDFARFRLAVAQYAAGSRAEAQVILAQIVTPAVRDAANAFVAAYKSSGSIIQACRDVDAYAKTHPAAWQYLADWGYANPSFTAEELCPLK